MGSMTTLLPLILLLVLMYFMLIRPQRKRDKETKAMRSSIQVGDEIVTIGGICAKVVKTKDETLIIQVGADKTKFEVMRWSVSSVVNKSGKAPAKAVEEEEEEKKQTKKPRRMKKAEAAEEVKPVEEAPVETVEEAPEAAETEAE